MAELLPLGVGGATILAPAGWEAVRVDAAAVGLEGGDLAAGVADASGRAFAANVLLYRVGPDAVADPADPGPDAWVLHDGPGPSGVERLQLRVVELAGLGLAQLLCWFRLADEPLLVQATWSAADLPAIGGDLLDVVRSVLPAAPDDLGRWLG